MTTYWLYLGNNPIGAVRLPAGSSDLDVRRKAIHNEDACATGHHPHGVTPYEFRNWIHSSDVRMFSR